MSANKDEEFNQIKKELVEEVRSMNDQVKGMRTDMNVLMRTVDIHDKVLFGDRFKEPGMTEDVRNLKKLAGYAISSIIGVLGLIGEFLFRTFFHHPKGG